MRSDWKKMEEELQAKHAAQLKALEDRLKSELFEDPDLQRALQQYRDDSSKPVGLLTTSEQQRLAENRRLLDAIGHIADGRRDSTKGCHIVEKLKVVDIRGKHDDGRIYHRYDQFSFYLMLQVLEYQKDQQL